MPCREGIAALVCQLGVDIWAEDAIREYSCGGYICKKCFVDIKKHKCLHLAGIQVLLYLYHVTFIFHQCFVDIKKHKAMLENW